MADVTVAATAEPGNTPPRIRLDVTDANLPENFSTTVLRKDAAGTTTQVRTADGNPLVLTTSGVTRVGTVYDYEAPLGVPVTYTTLESPSAVSAQVTLTSDVVWLVHPGVPALSRIVTVAEFGPRERSMPQGVFYPLGRRDPVVHTDGQRKAAAYSMAVLTQTDEELRALDVLLEDSGPLLLNVPPVKGFGVTHEYVSVGDVVEERVVRFAGNPARRFRLSCAVIGRPVGGSQAQRTWVDVIGNYATWADVMAAYPTWLDVITGP